MPDGRIRSLMVVLGLALMVVLVVQGCSDRQPESTRTPTTASVTQPTPTLTEPAATASATDDTWSRIQASGKLVVGTAADYPPFEFYTADFQLDGFDIALIREIGQRLGVDVEIKNMAFDGLGNALYVRQIDVAIAAITVTPGRENLINFTDVYYVSEDAVLARSDSSIVAIRSVEQMAGRRVGVQSATVFEDWLQSSLVDTGLTAASNLHVYGDIDKAIADVTSGRVDLAVMDLPPAEVAVERGGVKIVGQGLNRQRFAIGIRKGTPTLQAELNRVLSQMQRAGRISELAQQHLGLDREDLIPVPTGDPQQPTATAQVVEPDCVDGMQHVSDLTFDDINMTAPPQLAPGQPFAKSWRVRNSGTCAWDSSFALVHETGNVPAARMGGEPAVVSRLVQPGEEYDFSVNLVAPLAPGIYQAFWTMRNGEGLLFGDRLVVMISVPAQPTPTPAPTQTPAPGITFTVDRAQINQGECVVLQWDVRNAQAVYLHPSTEPWEPNGVPAQGTRTDCPSKTTTYNLRVVHPGGTIVIRQITVQVAPVAGAPSIDLFSLNPPYQAAVGQSIEIQWAVSGNVGTVNVLRNDGVLWADAPQSGRIQDSPPGAGQVTYGIEANGPGGTSRAQRTVTVGASTGPTPTPGVAPPIINVFEVNPTAIQTGQCVIVSWAVSGGTQLVQIRKNGVVVLDNAPFSGRVQDCLSNPGTVNYRLEAINAAGQMDFRERPVYVVVSGARPQGGILLR